MARENKASPPNRCNLTDEKWALIAGKGLVSLRQIFTDTGLRSLGGDPVQKVAVLKLLLAVSQAAYTPADTAEWEKLGAKGLAKKVLEYLKTHYDDFWLYGKKPFLQIPAIAAAEKQPFGAVMPDIATGNTTVLTQTQRERDITDAEKALLVVRLMGFALGGKKTDNSVVLSRGYQEKCNDKGKPSTGKPGASIGFLGYLHSFLTGTSLVETLWLNLLTREDIENLKIFTDKATHGLGPVPWETPPAGERDAVAERLKKSLMGRLVPFSRFVLLAEDGIHYSEGVLHPNHKDGIADPSMAINKTEKEYKVFWADPSRRPWRNLTSLLGFLRTGEQYFECPYIRLGIDRIIGAAKKPPVIGIWSAGLRVSSNAGEQYVSGTDDYVESETFFESSVFGENLYVNLKSEMNTLDELSRVLYGRVAGYYRGLKVEGESFAKQASELYWQLCERRFQELVNACDSKEKKPAAELRPYFLRCVQKSYEAFCSRGTARQLEAWAENYPNLGKYAAADKEPAEAVNL
ncbi:MAG: type I-E CRISPR-associated protein Cse1/CasA [Treponema sp.]|jgi:CRISPR system Cascade subunit CasA|nr:type I-E CRISPR-associated protein Cse1/CasA [Treponema sp.]